MATNTNTDYGQVLHSTILKIFGDEMSYNELKPYTKDENDTSKLEIITVSIGENHLVHIIIDDVVMLDKNYSINHSCDMFIYIHEMEEEWKKAPYEDEDENEDEDE
jgi:hypothetical protein